MDTLRVSIGEAARERLCAAFDAAQASITASFYSISDPNVIAHLNAAAQRHVAVSLHVEGNPHRFGRKPDTGERTSRGSSIDVAALRNKFVDSVSITIDADPTQMLHEKSVVVDGTTAYVSTANPTKCGFLSPGQVLVEDRDARDAAALISSIEGTPCNDTHALVCGPGAALPQGIGQLMSSASDLRVATEDLSDPIVLRDLCLRADAGHHDEVLIEGEQRGKSHMSPTQRRALKTLRSHHVEVRTLATGYMHEKYVDGGATIYVGSANLTFNGLHEAREAGIIASAESFGQDAQLLRDNFDRLWQGAVAV